MAKHYINIRKLNRVSEELLSPYVNAFNNFIIHGEKELPFFIDRLYEKNINKFNVKGFESDSISIIRIQAPEKPSEKQFVKKILDVLDFDSEMKAPYWFERTNGYFQTKEVKILIIENIEGMMCGNSIEHAKMRNILVSMTNQFFMKIVVTSSSKSLESFYENEQLVSRFYPIYVKDSNIIL